MLPAGGSGGCRSLPSGHPPGRVPRQKQAARQVRARCTAQGPVERTKSKKLLQRWISTQGSSNGVQKLPFHPVDGRWQRWLRIPALRVSPGPRAALEAGPAWAEGALYSSVPSGGHIHPKKTASAMDFAAEGPKMASERCLFTLLPAAGSVVADPCPPGIPRDTCRARSRPRAGGGRAA